MEIRHIQGIRLNDHQRFAIAIRIVEDQEQFIFSADIEDTVVKARAEGMFETFQLLRDSLLEQGIGLLCQGAKENVMQSAMAYATDQIYQLTLGRQALAKDKVSIFDAAELNEFCTSKEQDRYAQQWLYSLKELDVAL